MGMNPLNLQLSVPRAPELSGIQQQAIQRPVTEQTMLEANALKQADEKLKTANLVDKTDKTLIRDKENSNPQGNKKKKQQEQHNSSEGKADDTQHPFKGHKFDIRL